MLDIEARASNDFFHCLFRKFVTNVSREGHARSRNAAFGTCFVEYINMSSATFNKNKLDESQLWIRLQECMENSTNCDVEVVFSFVDDSRLPEKLLKRSTNQIEAQRYFLEISGAFVE
jgi:hypothetical protein